MSLIDAAEGLAAIDRSAVMLDSTRCLHIHERNAACEACFEVCPCDAITRGKPPTLDSAKCQNCLACLTVCPTGAYSADDAVPSLLRLSPHLEENSMELVCGKNPAPASGAWEHGMVVLVQGCLAGLGTGAYMALAALGLGRITVRSEACPGCEWRKCLPQIEVQVEHARRLLAAWDKTEVISIAAPDGTSTLPVWDSDNPPLSRRDLFRMMAHQGQVALSRAMENGQHTPGRRPGRDRLRTVAAVVHLPVPEHEPALDLRDLGFASVTVSEACSACGACAKACPTEGLIFEKDEDNTRFALKFLPRNCIACGLCVRVCMPEALSIGQPSPLLGSCINESATLQEGKLVKCTHCGVMMAKRGEHKVCEVCDYRRTHPFGSVLPPGARRIAVGGGDNRR